MIDKKTQNAMDAVTKVEAGGVPNDKYYETNGSVRNGSVINMPITAPPLEEEEIPDKGPIPYLQRWITLTYIIYLI